MNRYICIHGHFYQPPRENPWLEEVELQDSAYPYHDWNNRITAECYARNASSRILDSDGRIIDIVDNYSKISFNFGPTLLSWMERHESHVYQSILEADRLSMERFSGHGSAIAQVYNHVIMPLATSKDKRTQVIWGIKDFVHRFKRKPEGMWLAETAADLETLDIMAEYGITFTILAPHQAKRVRNISNEEWWDVRDGKIDPKMPYLCKLPSGGEITIFFYDGHIAQDIAFGDLLHNGEIFANRLVGTFSDDQTQSQIAHIATDGESYGHHHRYGDMALAYCLYYIESNDLARITIYGEYLEKHSPAHEVEIIDNTSWSCIHGVERWKSNCGCASEMHGGWTQEWRAPLRGAMDWLRDALVHLYEEEMAKYIDEQWEARDDYIEVVLDRSGKNVEGFLSNHANKELSKEDKVKVLKLLEMQRHALLMYSSCGWFFNEISRIETVQVIEYAARAMQLAREVSGIDLVTAFINVLERAPSNIPDFLHGAQIYEMFVKPAVLDLFRVGAHYGVSSLFEEYPETIGIYSYTANREVYDRVDAGVQKLALGRAFISSNITWEEKDISFAVLHFGDHNLNGGVQEFAGEESYRIMHQEIKDAFMRSDIPEVIRLMDTNFGTHNYSLWHLFKDEQRKILNQIIAQKLEEVDTLFRQAYENNYPIMLVMKDMLIPLPRAFAMAGEFILNADLVKLLKADELDLDKLQHVIDEIKKWSFELDKPTLVFVANKKINLLMEGLYEKPEDAELLEIVKSTLKILDNLPLELDLRKAQNIYFSIGKELYSEKIKKADEGDESAKKWVDHFNNLQHYLHVRLS